LAAIEPARDLIFQESQSIEDLKLQFQQQLEKLIEAGQI